MEQLAPAAERRGDQLITRLDPALAGREVFVDGVRIRQVLLNLLSNAVKFTESGTVALAATRDGEVWVLEVQDTGIGMDAEAQARVFEAFVQADSKTTRRFGGTGLGLTITKHLVERMGGTIALASAAGQGTRFTVRLPTAWREAPKA